MQIAGFQKLSMLDYPQEPCAVVFTPRCNMDCYYCHNAHILHGDAPVLDERDVLSHLEKRFGMIRAVVISGGEPTIQPGLADFIGKVRKLGYRVKLDTNGTRPDVILDLTARGYLDYIAMDIKAGAARYDEVTRVKNDMSAIRRSILLLVNGSVPYEFRTTFAPTLTQEDILSAASMIGGAQRYYLQQYRKRSDDDPAPHNPSYLRQTADAVREAIGVCETRGV